MTWTHKLTQHPDARMHQLRLIFFISGIAAALVTAATGPHTELGYIGLLLYEIVAITYLAVTAD